MTEIVGLLLERRVDCLLLNQAGADQIVNSLAEADGPLPSQLLDGCGNIVGEGDGGAYDLNLTHQDA